MTISMYQFAIPVFVRGLNNLAGVLEKARADAEQRGFDPAVLISARLAPDMFALARQVQIACDMVKNAGARLAGITAPAFPDTETSFPELQARITGTIGFLNGIDAALWEGSDRREITMKIGPQEVTFAGADYLTGFVLPNFYFHCTTAYNILRHNGVKLGKRDFVGAP